MARHLWVVECREPNTEEYLPLDCWASSTRTHGRRELAAVRKGWSGKGSKFRLKKYVPAEPRP